MEENKEVLKACHPLSDRSLERLMDVIQVIQKRKKIKNIEQLENEYKVLVSPSQKVQLKGPDNITENWGDRVIKK